MQMINQFITNNREERGNLLQKLITKYIVLSPPYFGSKSDYESLSNFKNKLIFIEREKNNQSVDNYIPCLFYRNPKSSNYLIYFHGNSEHIFQIEFYGLDFRSYLDMNVILVEYPGYSIYQSKSTNPITIFSNSLIVYDWVKEKFNAKDDQIFVCGRSIGTGSAIHLASKRNPRALFLISAFTSLKNIGKDHNVSMFLEEIFNSYRYIPNIKCPILFIHGKQDSLINYKHSEDLLQEIKNNNNKKVELHLNPNMTHNDFSLKNDIIIPMKNFIDKYELKSNEPVINMSENEINNLYSIPLSISQIIESELFDINDFILNKKINIKNAMFFTKSIDNNLIFTSGTKILFYNQRNFNLDDEIEIKANNKNIEIKALYQMKDKNIICGTDDGDIFMYGFKGITEGNINNFEDSDEEYKEIKHIKLEGEIFKIDKFLPDKICILNKSGLLFCDENLNEIISIKFQKTFKNFVQISEGQIAMLSSDYLAIFQIKENGLQEINRYNKVRSNYLENILITTDNYIILGDSKYIYFLDYKGNKNMSSKIENGEITYVNKIHDRFFLASTSEGAILQIILDKEKPVIKSKIFNHRINSFVMKNFKTMLFTDENSIQIFKKNEDKCNIY